MTTTSDELSDALADVRRAYRLVYAYQRRVFDLMAEVDGTLTEQGLAFVKWSPLFNHAPPAAKTPFFKKRWAWDMLPGWAVSCRWEDPKLVKGLQRRLVFQSVADTGRKYDGAEPDPVDFDEVTQCRSELRIGRWTTSAKAPDWAVAWEKVSAIDDYWARPQIVEIDGATYTYHYLGLDLAELVDPGAVQSLVIDPLERWAVAPRTG